MAEMVGGKQSVSTLLHKLGLFPPIEWLDPRLILCIGAPTCQVPDDWLLQNRRALLFGRDVLKAVMAAFISGSQAA